MIEKKLDDPSNFQRFESLKKEKTTDRWIKDHREYTRSTSMVRYLINETEASIYELDKWLSKYPNSQSDIATGKEKIVTLKLSINKMKEAYEINSDSVDELIQLIETLRH